ncbi:MAG: LytTR family DNA-binding domain-containing protein [Lutimonas sp.]
MQLKHLYKILFWFCFTLLIAFLFKSSFHRFWQAWITAIMLLPSVVVVKYGLEQSNKQKRVFSKGVLFFFYGILCLYLSYMAILAAYWYFLELDAEAFNFMIVNPVFIWVSVGFFVFLEQLIFKAPDKEEELKTVTIFSERKKTVLQIDQIAYVESRADFTVAHLETGESFKNSVKISQWEQRLPDFLRIHRSFLVNPQKATLHGSKVRVSEDEELPVSRGYKTRVEAFFLG